jgi:hypothetical protein
MKLPDRLRPSPAMVVSCIALGVALGGTSVAAINALPRNSVGTTQLKNGAVTKKKINKKTIAQLRGNRGPRGLQGPQGAQGAQGAQGVQGIQGIQGPAGVVRSAVISYGVAYASGSHFYYPAATNTFTPSVSGSCAVTATTQIFTGGATTEEGPYFRLAAKRGGVDANDGTYGHYFVRSPDIDSTDMTRSSVFNVTAGQPTLFGVFLGSAPSTGGWGGGSVEIHLTYICYTPQGSGGAAHTAPSASQTH